MLALVNENSLTKNWSPRNLYNRAAALLSGLWTKPQDVQAQPRTRLSKTPLRRVQMLLCGLVLSATLAGCGLEGGIQNTEAQSSQIPTCANSEPIELGLDTPTLFGYGSDGKAIIIEITENEGLKYRIMIDENNDFLVNDNDIVNSGMLNFPNSTNFEYDGLLGTIFNKGDTGQFRITCTQPRIAEDQLPAPVFASTDPV